MKIKLDKLIYRKETGEPIDVSVLDKAKRAMALDALNPEPKPIKQRERKTRRNFWIGVSSVAACIAISLSIALPLTLTNPKPNADSNLLYCYEGDYEEKNYESIEKYNAENATNLFYFETDRIIDRDAHIYRYKNENALLNERVLFLDTYEEIFLYVGRKEYDFEFLKTFWNLSETVTIGGREIRYESVFDESVYLYRTRVDWTEGDYHYRILFKLLKPDEWKDWLQTVFDR